MAKAVRNSYGDDYREATDYLEGLAQNKFYSESVLTPLPWHETIRAAPGMGDAIYQLHPTVVASLAPGVALRAAFGGARNA